MRTLQQCLCWSTREWEGERENVCIFIFHFIFAVLLPCPPNVLLCLNAFAQFRLRVIIVIIVISLCFLSFYTVLNNTSCTPRHTICDFGLLRIVTIASKSGKNIAKSSLPVKLRRLKRENVALCKPKSQTITTISERHVASITTQITKKMKKREKQIIESTMTNTIILLLYFPVRVALWRVQSESSGDNTRTHRSGGGREMRKR